jgi:hypothetical protein
MFADGVIAEVIYPNTVPPFFPNFVLFAQPPTPDEYEHRHAGVQAHNRWLADYVSRAPERRAGIGQIFLNDVDDAIADAIWCKENGLRGGVLIGAVPPTAEWIKPLYHPDYDELWAACAENNIPVNAHSGTGGPKYHPAPAMPLVHFIEIPYYSQRPLVHTAARRNPSPAILWSEGGRLERTCSGVDPFAGHIRMTQSAWHLKLPPAAANTLAPERIRILRSHTLASWRTRMLVDRTLASGRTRTLTARGACGTLVTAD